MVKRKSTKDKQLSTKHRHKTKDRVTQTPLCDKFCQWFATGRWFYPGTLISSTNEADRHDITEILLKVALNIIKQTNKHTYYLMYNVMYMYISWIDPVSFLLFITTPYPDLRILNSFDLPVYIQTKYQLVFDNSVMINLQSSQRVQY
jgi:hypothetical protein